jgi:ABC-type lipoprotein export system ATPase subunit
VALEGVLLRIIVLIKMGFRRVLFLDESLDKIDNENHGGRAAQLLRTLCERFDLDILFITHKPAFAEGADRVYRAVKRNDRLKLSLEKSEVEKDPVEEGLPGFRAM